MLLRAGGRGWPVMVDGADGRRAGPAYVTNLRSAYARYPLGELGLLPSPAARLAARGMLGLVDLLLRVARVEAAVHLDHWLTATSLHDGWDGTGLPALRALLAARFPDHLIVLRSLDR